MLGLNKKAANVIWRHPRYNRVAVLEIRTSPTEYAVATVDSQVASLHAEFSLDCLHGTDNSRQATYSCHVLAMSRSKDAMLLVAKEISSLFDVTRSGYKDQA